MVNKKEAGWPSINMRPESITVNAYGASPLRQASGKVFPNDPWTNEGGKWTEDGFKPGLGNKGVRKTRT